jgi:hypothetical protein
LAGAAVILSDTFMRTTSNFFVTIVSGLLIALYGGSLAYAATPSPASINGGNNATDYQPTTRNPQEGAVPGFQQNASALQPTPGNNAIGQENLPVVSDLHVLGAKAQPNPNVTKTDIPRDTKPSPNLWPVALVGVITVAAIIYVIAQPDPDKRRKTPIQPTGLLIEKPDNPKPKKKASRKKRSRK